MTITIFMPVRNARRHIGAALSCLEAQTAPDWRLVILDGVSTDGTLELAAERAAADQRIELRSAPDSGQYDALIRGIADTDCDHIGWLNADDLYPPWALAEAMRAFEAMGADWITGLPGLWDEEGRLRTVYPVGRRSRRLIRAGWYHDGLLGCLQQESIFFRKRLFDRLTAEDRRQIVSHPLAGDYLLWRRFAQAASLETVPTVLGGFRRHGANRSLEGEQDYVADVRALGGPILPPWLARRVRSLHDYWAAMSGVKAARRAALDLANETDR